jgi:hypothetical protein
MPPISLVLQVSRQAFKVSQDNCFCTRATLIHTCHPDDKDLATASVELLFSIVSANDGIVNTFSSSIAPANGDFQRTSLILHLICHVDPQTDCSPKFAVPITNEHNRAPCRLAKMARSCQHTYTATVYSVCECSDYTQVPASCTFHCEIVYYRH